MTEVDFSGGAFGEGLIVDVLMIGGSVQIAVGKVEPIAVVVTFKASIVGKKCWGGDRLSYTVN